jgi:hypothetical protein
VTRAEFGALTERVAKLEAGVHPPLPPQRTVDVTAVPSDRSVQLSWTVTDAAHVASFTVSRDGADSTGTGPWSTTEPADSRGRLFTKLNPGVSYGFRVTAAYVDGETVTATAEASPAGVTPVPPPRPSGLPWESGVFAAFNRERVITFGLDRGAPADHVSLFPTRTKGWAGLASPWYLDRAIPGLPIVVGLPLWPEKGGTLDDDRDDIWTKVALQIAGFDPTARIRLGWEMNIGQPWRITPGNAAAWIARWRRTASVMLDAAPGLRLGWNPNSGNDQTGVNSRTAFQQVADLTQWVGVDSYDIWEPVTSDASEAEHVERLDEWRRIAVAHGQKFAVPEWGPWSGTAQAGHAGGDNPRYMRAYVGYFRDHAADLEFESYFEEPMAYIRSGLSQNPRAAAAYRDALSDARTA